MSFGCASPASLSEDDWVNEILTFSPLDLTQSNDVQSSLQSPEFGPQANFEIAPDFEDLFSLDSNCCTSVTTPNAISKTNSRDTQNQGVNKINPGLLDNVSYKLQKLKEDHLLTPKALESVFNTQDVLADSGDWQADPWRHKHKKFRASHTSLSSCISHDPSPLKNDCHIRKNASSFTSAAKHCLASKKRNNSKGKMARPSLIQSSSAPLTRTGSLAHNHVTAHTEDDSYPSLPTKASFYEAPCFPESWYFSPFSTEQDETVAGAADVAETCFKDVFAPMGVSETAVFPTAVSYTSPPVSYPVPASLFPSSDGYSQSKQKQAAFEQENDSAIQAALAFIDYSQEENMLRQASFSQTN